MTDRDQSASWTATTWEGSRRLQIEHWAQLTLDELFAALEEMAKYADDIACADENGPHSQGEVSEIQENQGNSEEIGG